MSTAKFPRLDWAPLDRYGVAACADAIGTDRSQVERWRREGLTITAADRIATAIGQHLYTLWPDVDDIVPMIDEKIVAKRERRAERERERRARNKQ